jgi:hypothetical protein
MGFYTSLYMLGKLIFGGGKKKTANAPVASHGHTHGEMPSVDSPEFDSWISVEGNCEKLFNSSN